MASSASPHLAPRSLFLVTAIASVLLFVPAVSVASGASKIPVVMNNQWAGYGAVSPVGGGGGAVYATILEFTQPKVECNSSSPYTQQAYVIAGIDGVPAGAPGDFEYTGTLASCPVGASSPTYTVASTATSGFTVFTVAPGDVIYANVTHFSVTHFVYFVDDITSGKTALGTSPSSSPALISAECVVYHMNPLPTGAPALLAKFKTLKAGPDGPHDFGCLAAIGSVFGPIGGGFAAGVTLYKYVMYNTASTMVIATPSALASNDASFKVHWHGYGP
jgi:Peptidase A4 family